MSLSNRDLAELETLCDALIDGAATDAQQARLAQCLSATEEARQFYVRRLGLSASLHDYFDPLPLPSAESAGALAAPLSRWQAWRWPIVWGSLAALATAAAILLAFGLPDRPGQADLLAASELEAEQLAAQITGVEDCRWVEPSRPLQPGDVLRQGQPLELAAGIAEITFDSGAQITLEGPARLTINSAWAATVARGKITAEVPHEAAGFRAASAVVDVLDLGTQFCMLVDADGATDVGVLEGSVEATPRAATGQPEPPVVLRQQRARRFRRAGNEEIANAASVFARFAKPVALERIARPVSFVHWSFDQPTSDTIHADYAGPATHQSDLTLEHAEGTLASDRRAAGRFGDALHFEGRLTAHALVPGLSNHAPRTVALWVKIPPDAPLTSAGSILAWATTDANETAIQPVKIGWNTNPEQGPLGALRTEIGRVEAVGTTDLRDDKWHHLAVEVSPHKHWQIKQYVDGQLERGVSKIVKRRRDSVGEAADDQLHLGQPLGRSSEGQERFHGDLDELFLSDRLLTPQQISQLMKQNELTATPAPPAL